MPARKSSRKSSKEKEAGDRDSCNSSVQVFDSIKAAAAGLGVAKYLLQRAKASGQCNDAFRGSRVYGTENLRLWIEAADSEPKEQDKAYWDSCIAKQEFEHREWKNAKERGEFVAKSVFAGAVMELASEQKSLVRQKLENEYPGLVQGLEPAQRAELKKVGRALADDICRRMQRLVDKWKS